MAKLVQPPSGGCVLKLIIKQNVVKQVLPAAFRRLCVETMQDVTTKLNGAQPPSGGCVLKPSR